MQIPKYFIWEDYITMNADLGHINTQSQAEQHWLAEGQRVKRLCNKKQLIVIGEFGPEIIIYIGYYYYLYKRGLFFNNVVRTYKGMRDFYYFLPDSQIIEEDRMRHFVGDIPFHVNNQFHVAKMDKRFWCIPPYKQVFGSKSPYEKPLLIIHNKYTVEWGGPPINYFSPEILREMCTVLQGRYQIIYERASNVNKILDTTGYSQDDNHLQEDIQDYELLRAEFPGVLLFNDLLAKSGHRYNRFKLSLYANCDNFISVQGGNVPFASFFMGNILVLHKRGGEIESGAYKGWMLETRPNCEKNLVVCKSDTDLLQQISRMF